MKHTKHVLFSLCTSTLLLTQTVYTSDDNNLTKSRDWIILPYAFSSDSTGITGGISAIKQGLFQPQTTLVTAVFGGLSEDIVTKGENEKANFSGAFFYFSDYKLPFTNRLFFSIIALKSYYPNGQYYLDGTHNSNKDNVFKTSGDSNFINTNFKYVLPIGDGIDNPEGVCTLHKGFCINREDDGGGAPFITGHTSIGVKTFYQYDTFENASLPGTPSWDTSGLRFYLEHDNTDFDLNPSRGYHFEVQYSKDFGWGDSLQRWDFLEGKYNHYINLDTFSFTKQNVLALSMWSGYSFSWDNSNEIISGINAHRPPTWEGARLGGFFKMRGYNNNRFSDKAAFYATAEYRAVLDYNPLEGNSLLPVAIDWFQIVGFVEIGRVHDKYNFDLISDIKYDVGISLRAMVAQLPVRFDIACGKEGTNLWLMINQPFDF